MRLAVISSRIIKGHGQGRVNYEIVRYAVGAGHSVDLFATEVDADLAASDKVRWVRVDTSALPTELLRNQVFAILTACWLARHRSCFDIVHADGFSTWLGADVNTAHFVHSAWLKSPYYRGGSGVRGAYDSTYSVINAALEKLAFRTARCVVAVSSNTREDLIGIKVRSEAIRVISNGVDTDEFRVGESTRANYPGTKDGLRALFAGEIRGYRKNLDTVLKALAAVRNVDLLVAGNERGSPFVGMAKQLGLQNRVHFLGVCSNMPELMRAVDLLVFPSRYETCGLVLLEALACGLPVITAKTAGGHEIVAQAGGLVLQGPEDAGALARWLVELQQGPEWRRELSQRARRTAEEHSWHSMAHSYVRLYTELVNDVAESRR